MTFFLIWLCQGSSVFIFLLTSLKAITVPFSIQRVSECTEEAQRGPPVWLNTASPALLFRSVLKTESQRTADQTVSWDSEEHMVGRQGKGEERKTREGEDRWETRAEKYRALWLVRMNGGRWQIHSGHLSLSATACRPKLYVSKYTRGKTMEEWEFLRNDSNQGNQRFLNLLEENCNWCLLHIHVQKSVPENRLTAKGKTLKHFRRKYLSESRVVKDLLNKIQKCYPQKKYWVGIIWKYQLH